MTEIRVMPADLPTAGLCVTGARTWFANNGLDFKQFIREGTPVSEMRATGCPLGERACIAAEARAERETLNGR